MFKFKIPEGLASDVPQTMWGRVLSATPVVMTVIATMLAGLASSEMTRAQYDRSLAAQQQSKAGDQWGFFQAKRLRGAQQRSTYDIFGAIVPPLPIDPAEIRRIAGQTNADIIVLLDAPLGKNTMAALKREGTLTVGAEQKLAPEIVAVQEAIQAGLPAAEIAERLSKVSNATVDEAVRAAYEKIADFDKTMKPVGQVVDRIESWLTYPGPLENVPAESVLALRRSVNILRRNFVAARLRFAAERYDAEARLNQMVGGLFELQVRKSNLSAERHHVRSQRFFYGMLAAQMAVIISTFAIAARKRNLLWSLAASAGLAAVSFTIYVYLYV